MNRWGLWGPVVLAVATGACGGSGDERVDAFVICERNEDCDDRVFCNGLERCEPSNPAAAPNGCLPGLDPCEEGVSCDEETDSCASGCVDGDGDGAQAVSCGGNDCDDSNPDISPSATEICDLEGVDEDCDPTTFGERDIDGDGYVDARCCNGDSCGRDCDETREGTNPGVAEVCDRRDNDCDGTVDEELAQDSFRDMDRDLHGDRDFPMLACPGRIGTSVSDLDCDDTDPFVTIGQREIAGDGVDNDCDGDTDEAVAEGSPWYVDGDGDGFGDPTEPPVVSTTPVAGRSLLEGDCDDGDDTISPGAEERCNALDDDCDGEPSFVIGVNDWEDDDGDGYPDAACASGANADCDDTDGSTHPNAAERCGDARDNDCDGTIDEGCSGMMMPPDGGMPLCGNGVVESGEQCDDGNTLPNDGCGPSCVRATGWSCGAPGAHCTAALCGDGVRAGVEQCDDGNASAGDGCAGCRVEAGWFCAGGVCGAARCGDGFRVDGEACDDGNSSSGDGCSRRCTVEAGYSCPTAGEECVADAVCGDGTLEAPESCDDGNSDVGDGCDGDCHIESGWACPAEGVGCVPRCGDGMVVGSEQCDDGGTSGGDGCSATCTREPGHDCSGGGCTPVVCGDGTPEGDEACDDGNDQPFDGCFQCKREPSCASGSCTATCGDGVVSETEDCDDGNAQSGDGCSATCVEEPGWDCSPSDPFAGSSVELPVLIRDFIGDDVGGHPDFEFGGGGSHVDGIVGTMLDGSGRPVPGTATGDPSVPTALADWYDTASSANVPLTTAITLFDVGGELTFQSSSFFPADGQGWVGMAMESPRAGGHNFHFTTETRFTFEYEGDEILTMQGDDDIFVFIDGRLCLDLGGTHAPLTARVDLADPASIVDGYERGLVQGCRTHLDSLVTGANPTPRVQVVVFHAERQTSQSNFNITLEGFSGGGGSTCVPTCGDGIVTSAEACDDGVNIGGYGGCQPGCETIGPYCGDGSTFDGVEDCDDGAANDRSVSPGCSPECVALSCGDGIVQSNEMCDDGVNDGGYGECAGGCFLGPYCGDGAIQSGETCDDGINDGGYGRCTPSCAPGPRCGDGVLQSALEGCDDGNLTDGDGCSMRCRRE